jgi:Cytochrome P460
MDGYRTGTFPDGSVLIDDLLEAQESKGITSEGPRRRLAVMVKESSRYPETGGWGFEIFARDNQADGTLTAEKRAACFACHQKARDSVFSQLRK